MLSLAPAPLEYRVGRFLLATSDIQQRGEAVAKERLQTDPAPTLWRRQAFVKVRNGQQMVQTGQTARSAPRCSGGSRRLARRGGATQTKALSPVIALPTISVFISRVTP